MATILIVDDQAMNRSLLVKLLRYASHQTLEASDGAEALAITLQARPDLVIADVLMPTMDGYEFVRQLRADPAIAGTPVIFFTAAYLEREAQTLARACGVEHILTKPASPQAIFDAIAAALGQRQPLPTPAPPVPSDDAFDREHVRLLTDKLAAKVDELSSVNSRLGTLLDLSRRLAAEHDPERLVQTCCEAAREIIGATSAVIDIPFDDGPGHFYASRAGDAVDTPLSANPLGRDLLERLRAEGGALRVRELDDGAHPPLRSFLGTPIASTSQMYGVLYLVDKLGADEFSAEDEQVVVTLAAQLAVAYENAQLFAQVRAGGERLRLLSQQLVQTQENERRAIARELHDEVGQSLTAALLNLQAVVDLPDPAAVSARLEDGMALIDRVLHQIRALSLDLRPALLDDLGLAPALGWLLERQAERAGFAAHFQADGGDERLPAAIETTCFRVVQEALTNIVRHAQARHVTVELRRGAAELRLRLCDDGIGFDVAAAQQRASRGLSLGLLSMQERIGLIGGRMQIKSAPGRGVRITVWLPLAPAAAATLEI